MPGMDWDEIIGDEEFQSQDGGTKAQVLNNWYQSNMPTDQEYVNLSPQDRVKVLKGHAEEANIDPSFWGEVIEPTITGTAETALTLATGMADFFAQAPAGLAGTAALIGTGDPERATEVVEKFTPDPITYQPSSEAGQRGVEAAALPFKGVHKVAETVGETASDVLGRQVGPEFGAAVGAGLFALTELSPILGPGILGRAFKQAGVNPNINLTKFGESIARTPKHKAQIKKLGKENVLDAFRGRETTPEAMDFVKGLSRKEKVTIAKKALNDQGLWSAVKGKLKEERGSIPLAPTYYSPSSAILKQKLPNKFNKTVALGMLNPKKGLVKQQEVGELQTWLEGKDPKDMITKQEVLDRLETSMPQPEISMKSGTGKEDPTWGNIHAEITDAIHRDPQALETAIRTNYNTDARGLVESGEVGSVEEAAARIAEDLYNWNEEELGELHRALGLTEQQSPAQVGRVKYADHMPEGGKEGTYNEMLVRLPETPTPTELPPDYIFTRDFDDKIFIEKRGETDSEIGPFANEEEAVQNFSMSSASRDYSSGHWAEPNVVAHIRFDERTGPKGQKDLFIGEMQSDWVGDIRGIQQRVKDGQEAISELQNLIKNLKLPLSKKVAYTAEIKEYEKEISNIKQTGPPPLPFEKNWDELSFKQVLRHAAENGFDRVMLPTAEQGTKSGLSLEKAQALYGTRIPNKVNTYIKKMKWDGKLKMEGAGEKPTPSARNFNSWANEHIPGMITSEIRKQRLEKGPIYQEYIRFLGREKGNPVLEITPKMKKDILEKGQPIASIDDKKFFG